MANFYLVQPDSDAEGVLTNATVVPASTLPQYLSGLNPNTYRVASLAYASGSYLVYSPVKLFPANEPGIWYQPSDLTTMFQDRAGTTPVTAPGQSVGLRLDKSKGLVLGPELVTNGDFSNGTTGWAATASTIAVVNGELEVTATGVSGQQATKDFSVVAGRAYRVTGLVRAAATNSVAKSARVEVAIGGTRQDRQEVDANGVTKSIGFTFFATATGVATIKLDVASIVAWGAVGDKAYFDNISVKELPGNHAVANSDAARGVYGIEPFGGRRNLLTYTEQFDNAAWTKIFGGTGTQPTVTSGFVAPNGTSSAWRLQANSGASSGSSDFSVLRQSPGSTAGVRSIWVKSNTASPQNIYFGTVANTTAVVVSTEWTRIQYQSVANNHFDIGAYPAINSSQSQIDLLIWQPQLETGSTATAYQKVVSQYEVTEAGKPTLHYVQYDGVDDGYVTPTITPGTDKVQVFAGVRKLSDVSRGMIVELNVSGATGKFLLDAPTGDGLASLGFTSVGTVASVSNRLGYPSPTTVVMCGIGGISTDTAILRINGTQVASVNSDQGTGDYAASQLYIGRRGGTTLPFNGRDYGLIVRFGSNLSAETIAATEAWMNGQTGAY